jgi:hypothetical protein
MPRWLKIGMVGCGGLVGLLVLLLIVLIIVVPSPKQNQASEETTKEETLPVVIRISGEPGTTYSCSYRFFGFEEGQSQPERFEERNSRTLGTEPEEYPLQVVNAYPWGYAFVAATCNITGDPNVTGSLKAEILADGQVKASEEDTANRTKSVEARWSPRCPHTELSWDCG